MRYLIRNKTTKRILWVLFVGILILSFFLGRQTPWKLQISMYEALRQTSILIFGLIGAWLAVLLPFAIEKGGRLKYFFDFSKKMFPALSAAIYLLIITIIIPFFVSIAQNNISLDDEVNKIFCGVSLSILAIGIVLLSWGLLMILASFDALKKDIELTESGEKLEKESKPVSKKTTTKNE